MSIIKAIQLSLTPDLLSTKYKKSVVPLEGHCYVAAEAAFHLFGKDQGLKPVVLNHKRWPKGLENGETHWFLRGEDQIVDPTAEQFGKLKIPYHKGKSTGFLTKEPSKRARTVIERVNLLLENKWDIHLQ